LKNKILITGGAGFIGSNFVELIVKNSENQIFVLDKLTYAGNLKNLEAVSNLPNYNFIKGDICDKELIESIFEEYQFNKVVHFAAESHVDNSITGPSTFIQTNIVGTFNLVAQRLLFMDDWPRSSKKRV
jgi:dTDP-glucose 4,6-dehydratase